MSIQCTQPTNLSLDHASVGPGKWTTLRWTVGEAVPGTTVYSTAVWRSTTADMYSGTLKELRQELYPLNSWPVQASSSNGTKYYYRCITVGTTAGSNSGFSDSLATLTAEYTNPTAPDALTIGSASPKYAAAGTTHLLAWSGESGGTNNLVNKFLIYKNGAKVAEAAASPYTITAPAAGAGDYYQVKSVAEFSSSALSAAVYLYSYSSPEAPTTVTATPDAVTTGGPVSVSWSGASEGTGVGISKYEVYRNGVKAGESDSSPLAVSASAVAGTDVFRVNVVGSVAGYNSGLSSASDSVTVAYPPSAGALDKTTVPMDGASVITLTVAPKSSVYTHKAVWSIGAKSWSDTMGEGDYVSALTVPANWCEEVTSALTGTASVELESYNGASLVGSVVYTFTVSVPASVVPTIVSVTDELVSNGVTEDITKYVQSHSKVAVTVNGAAGAHGSTIESYSITGGGFSAASGSATFGPMPNAGSVTFTAIVTDSRGRTAAATVTITVEAYTKPSLLDMSIFRSDEYGTEDDAGGYARLYAKEAFSSIGGENEATLEGRVYMKGAVPGAYTGMADQTEAILGGGALLTTKTYVGEIHISDLLYDFTYSAQIPTESVGLHILDEAAGAAVGKYCETPGMFEIPDEWESNISLKAYPVDAVYTTSTNTSPEGLLGGTWTSLGSDTLFGVTLYAWKRTA